MLEIRNVTKNFRRKRALNQINCKIDSGIYGLIGSNGAGKTTLLRCLTGLYRVNQGEILWNGEKIQQSRSYKDSIGYLPQKLEVLKDLKVKEYMEYFGDAKEMDPDQMKKEILEILERLNLKDHMEQKVGSLSGGMTRRLGIAQALLNDPKLLIFDEPTAGLDPEERMRFKNLIAELAGDRMIIISTHIVEDIDALCDQVIVMKKGRLLGTYSLEELHKPTLEDGYLWIMSEGKES